MSGFKPKILIVDDDRIVCRSLQLLFNINGFEAHYLINPLNIIEYIGGFSPDILILDLNFSLETSGAEGLAILHKVRVNYPDLSVMLLTAWGSMELAVKGMKAGAVDFLTKPWNNEAILDAVRTQLNLKTEEKYVTANVLDNWTGASPLVMAQKKLILKAAQSNLPVLISGEKGTGHQEVVQIIHQLSERKSQPLVQLEAGPEFEQNLLGYRQGALKGKDGDKIGELTRTAKGILWIENLEKLSYGSQTLLLSVIQNEKYRPFGALIDFDWKGRVITTTTQKYPKEFIRDDLWYKLNILHVQLPALSETREDIPLIIEREIERFNAENNKVLRLEPSALDWLSVRDYQGNLEELKHIVRKACVLTDQNLIRIKLLKEIIGAGTSPLRESSAVEEAEMELIRKTLQQKKGKVSEAAKSLGLSRSALYRRMAKFGLNKPEGNED